MVKEVKVLWFSYESSDRHPTSGSRTLLSAQNFEKTLLELLNQGWAIIASGANYIILKRDE